MPVAPRTPPPPPGAAAVQRCSTFCVKKCCAHSQPHISHIDRRLVQERSAQNFLTAQNINTFHARTVSEATHSRPRRPRPAPSPRAAAAAGEQGGARRGRGGTHARVAAMGLRLSAQSSVSARTPPPRIVKEKVWSGRRPSQSSMSRLAWGHATPEEVEDAFEWANPRRPRVPHSRACSRLATSR